MPAITFESTESTFTLLDPQKGFAPESHRVEIRKDPLLGDTSVYNPFLRDKAKAFFGQNDPALVAKLVEESSRTCIFCGEHIEKVTPRYPDGLVPGGRIRKGEALLFPNLFSIGQYHAVVSLSAAHFLKLSEYAPGLIENGLRAAQEFLHAVFRSDPGARFVTVSANYLAPAGASLVHPHLQMLVTPAPYSSHARLSDACSAYCRRHGSAYHDDLVAGERKSGARYVGQRGRWHWLAAFSPMGSNEVTAVHERECDFGRMDDGDLRDLASGISRVLAFYEAEGYLSFNYSLFALRQPGAGEGHRCLLRIINRQNLYPNYRNDDYFLQKLLQTELIITPPEEMAAKLRTVF